MITASMLMMMATSKADLASIPNLHPDRIPYMSIACALIEHILGQLPSVGMVLRSRHTLAEGLLTETAAGWKGPESQVGWEMLTDL